MFNMFKLLICILIISNIANANINNTSINTNIKSLITKFNQYRNNIQFQQLVKQLAKHYKIKYDVFNNISKKVSRDNISKNNVLKVIKNAIKIYKLIENYNKIRKKLKVYHFDNGHYMCSPTGMLQMINILYKNGDEAGKKLKSFLKHIEEQEAIKPNTQCCANTQYSENTQRYVTMADMLVSWYNTLSDNEKQKIPMDAYMHFTGVHERCNYITDLTFLMKLFPNEIHFSYLPKKSNKRKLAFTSNLNKDNLLTLDRVIDKNGISEFPRQFIASIDQKINSKTIFSSNNEYSLDNNQFLLAYSNNDNIVIYELQAVKITAVDPSRKYKDGPRKGQTLDDHHVRMILKVDNNAFVYADPKLDNYFERSSIKKTITDPEAKPSGNPDLNYNPKFNIITNVVYKQVLSYKIT